MSPWDGGRITPRTVRKESGIPGLHDAHRVTALPEHLIGRRTNSPAFAIRVFRTHALHGRTLNRATARLVIFCSDYDNQNPRGSTGAICSTSLFRPVRQCRRICVWAGSRDRYNPKSVSPGWPAGRGPSAQSYRRSLSRIGRSLMLAMRHRIKPRSSNSQFSLPYDRNQFPLSSCHS